MHFPQKMIEKLESLNYTLKDWVLVFVSVVLIKMILNTLSGNSVFTMSYLEIFIHSVLIYALTAVTIMIFLMPLVKEKLKKIASIAMVASTLMILVNIIDLILSKGKDYFRAYIFTTPDVLFKDFVTFFGDNPTTGITYGMRVQAALMCIFIAIYVFIKTRKYWKAILGAALAYITAFVYFSLPSIIGSAFLYFKKEELTPQMIIAHFSTYKPIVGNFLIDRYNIFDIKFSLWLAVFLAVALVILYCVSDWRKAIAFVKNLRITRALAQLIIFFGGFLVAWSIVEQKPAFGFYDWLSLAVMAIAVFFNWVFALCLNDIYDREVDKISNKERPLARGIISIEEFKAIGFLSLVLSLGFALLVDYRFFLFMAVLTALPYLYSAPPLRLRRFVFASNAIIAFHSVLLVMLGALFLSSTPHMPGFPRPILLAVFIIVFLISSIKDIKDREADKMNGIATVPTIFGEKNGKLVTACMFAVAYLIPPIALGEPMLFFAGAGFAIFTFLILAAKQLQERWMFIITLCYLVIVFWVTYL